jgi:hypothetical protein
MLIIRKEFVAVGGSELLRLLPEYVATSYGKRRIKINRYKGVTQRC